jgi:hypothetical protein
MPKIKLKLAVFRYIFSRDTGAGWLVRGSDITDLAVNMQ